MKRTGLIKHLRNQGCVFIRNKHLDNIQTLYMLGTTINAIPEDTLSMIETVAKQCADKLENSGEKIDESALMKSMQGMLGAMLKK